MIKVRLTKFTRKRCNWFILRSYKSAFWSLNLSFILPEKKFSVSSCPLTGPVHTDPALHNDLSPQLTSLPPELAFNSSPPSSPSAHPPAHHPPHPAHPPHLSPNMSRTRPKLVSRSSSASLKSMGSMHSDQILCPMLKWLLSGLLARSFFLAGLQGMLL